MNTFAALLRGINVGGHGILPMKELRAVLESLGLRNVRTYLQSGNVVFQTDGDDGRDLAEAIAAAIQESHGFTPQVLVLSAEELQAAMDANPFPEGEQEPKTVHFCFLKARPVSPDLAKLESLRTKSERFELVGSVFYLHTPDGMARSRLASNIERVLGVAATARNWRSVQAVLTMANEEATA